MAEEREMSRNQRGLVDTCFEEGQYGPAIAVLDQLRSSSFTPPPDHIRQLLYIALFPPSPATGDQTTQQMPPSPVKGSPTKQKPALSRISYAPSATDSEAAQRVLFSFLGTNSPVSLFRALPRYPLDDSDASGSSGYDGDQDSYIALESLRIRDCKTCWPILKEGFIQREKLLPQGVRKERGRAAYKHDDDLDEGPGMPEIVAEHAWPVFEWLLSLFEKDELVHCQKSGENFSPLLLSQIPPPWDGTGPRWDTGAPLDILFHSVGEAHGKRRETATRLLTLLINLSRSRSFDELLFATTLTMRLHASSPQTIQNLMESLPKTVPVLGFKIVVCQKFLAAARSVAKGIKPRPRPLPRRGPRRNSETRPSAADTDVGQSHPPRPALPTCEDVFRLLCSDDNKNSPKSTLAPPELTIKYSLLMSYAHLQALLPPGERDGDWQDTLRNGRLKLVIDSAFPSDSTYHRALAIVSAVWQVGDTPSADR